MNEIETEFLKIHELQPFFWHFCIGNIFLIWIHGEEKLTQFLNELNNFHYGWKFIYEISSFTVNFLDLNVGLRNSAIHKDIKIFALNHRTVNSAPAISLVTLIHSDLNTI